MARKASSAAKAVEVVKRPKSAKRAVKVARIGISSEAALVQLRESIVVEEDGRVVFPNVTLLCAALDVPTKGVRAFALVHGECAFTLDTTTAKGVCHQLRREDAVAWLDTTKSILRVRWNRGKGGYNLWCGNTSTYQCHVLSLDKSMEPATGEVITSILACTVGAFRSAFTAADLARYDGADDAHRDILCAMRVAKQSSGAVVLMSTDGHRAHVVHLAGAKLSDQTAPVLPGPLCNRIPALLKGVPDEAQVRIIRSKTADDKLVTEVRLPGGVRIACSHEAIETPNIAQVAPAYRTDDASEDHTAIALDTASLEGFTGKRPKEGWVKIGPCPKRGFAGVRLFSESPESGDSILDVPATFRRLHADDKLHSITCFPGYLLDAMRACGGGTCVLRWAGPREAILVQGTSGMALVMPRVNVKE